MKDPHWLSSGGSYAVAVASAACGFLYSRGQLVCPFPRHYGTDTREESAHFKGFGVPIRKTAMARWLLTRLIRSFASARVLCIPPRALFAYRRCQD